MPRHALRSLVASIPLLACAAFLIPGCKQGVTVVPVSGKVLIDGQVLTHGTVQIAPAGSRPAFAEIGPDGVFTLTTYKPNDGLATGTHPAAVIAHETLGPGKQRWHAPKKYISTDTSGLNVTIDGPTNDLVIKLTWEGSGHTGPYIETQETE